MLFRSQLGLYIATPAFDGLHREDLEALMKEAGMNEHIAKPVDVELLVKVIHKLANR